VLRLQMLFASLDKFRSPFLFRTSPFLLHAEPCVVNTWSAIDPLTPCYSH
jgi:hypothetical protein